MTPRVGSLAVSVVLLALPAAAQNRDNSRGGATTGAGAITGTVVSDEASPRPVRRAIVTLNSQDPLVGRTGVTDDAGRFVFAGLPAARYTLSATKRGWIGASYGAKAINRPGRALQLAAGERATATIRMARGSVITGTILDQFGQPVPNLTVRAMKYGYLANTGERRLTPASPQSATPDERGAYRLYGLAPGEYYISVSNPSAAFLNGRDLHLTSDVDVDEAMKAAQQGPSVPATDVPQRNVGFSQVFYPGTTSAAQATPIAVRAGEERAGVDFAISYTPTARVEGTLAGPAGTPVAGRITLVANDPASPGIGIESIRNTSAGPDGHFTFAEVAPGSYLLSAQTVLPPETPGGRPQVMASPATDLEVTAEGNTGLSVVLQEGFSVSGVIRYEGAGTPPNFAALRVTLQPVQNGTSVSIAPGGQTTTADGHFTLNGVTPGRYRLAVGPPPPRMTWRIRSATMLGQDALELGAEVRVTTTDAVIVLSDAIADLTGKVEAAAGGSADYTMILFPADRALWRTLSRRIMTARVASDASFSFRNVPPGDYLLAPVDDVEPGEWFDPAFLQRVSESAVHVTIGEAEKKVQDIRIGGL